MNLFDPQRNPSLSEDLTVVLLRGNGSPRTFRLSLPTLQRSLTALGFLFAVAVSAAVFLALLHLFRPSYSDRAEPNPAPVAAPVAVTPAPVPAPAPAAPAATEKGFWGSLTRSESPAPSPSNGDLDAQKEMQGLREDIAKLNAELNGRKNLSVGANAGLLQFFGPRNLPDTTSPMQVKNVKVVRQPGAKELYVDFELHNVDPAQKPVRGFIVVLAKTGNFLMSYPENAFSPTQNVVLDFTKGETFGVSRFRQARANFSAAELDGKHPRFQVLLFATDGRVLADLHVEEGR